MTHHPNPQTFAAKLPLTGYRPLYHGDAAEHCPGCHGTHWIIGRSTAECARCAAALPLAKPSEMSS